MSDFALEVFSLIGVEVIIVIVALIAGVRWGRKLEKRKWIEFIKEAQDERKMMDNLK